MEYPKIRPVSAFPIEIPEGQFICLQDPNCYLEHPVIVSPEMFSVIQFFDGKRSLPDIQEAYMKRYGITLYTEQIRQIVEQLDQNLLLESPAFYAHVERLRREYAQIPVRVSSHKGAAYPEEKAALCHQLESYFTNADGPGELCISQSSSSDTTKSSTIEAIMAPHIDLKAGGTTYAWTYHALANSDADLFVILGTSHVEMNNFFALTKKTFETPFGQLKTDLEFVNALSDQLSYDPFKDELIHKYEHSIEFQVIFLQYWQEYIRKATHPVKIVPILCGGSMHEAIAFNQPIENIPQLEESIQGLQHVLRQHKKVCIIASVDFSHIGLRYGDPKEPSRERLEEVQHSDRNLLKTMEHAHHKAFIAQLQKNRNETQVCGYVPMYTMLRCLDGVRGSLLHYKQAEFGEGSFVSFASMIWKTEE